LYSLIHNFYQLDGKNVFRNGNLKEQIDKEQLPDFVAKEESSKLVCHLCKSLYGFKQSLRTSLGKISNV